MNIKNNINKENIIKLKKKKKKALFLISNFVKHVKKEISKGNLDSILLLRSNSITSGQLINKFIRSSDVSFIFL